MPSYSLITDKEFEALQMNHFTSGSPSQVLVIYFPNFSSFSVVSDAFIRIFYKNVVDLLFYLLY